MKGGKNKVKNKLGKASPIVTVGIVVGILLLCVVAYGVYRQSVITEKDYTLGDCENEPYVDTEVFNEYSRSSLLGPTFKYVIGDEPAKTLTNESGGTAFSVGDKMTIFTTLTGYLDRVDEFTITKCGANQFTTYLSEADAITIDILDDRLNEVTDSATASETNITQGGADTSANFVIEVKGVRDKSTGQVLLTLEGNDTEIDDITIKPRTAGASVIDDNYNTDLSLFSAEGTAPVCKFAFVVDSVEDGGSDEYTLTATAESGEYLGTSGAYSGFLFVNAYAGQWFVDVDGSLKFGFEDDDGTLKYEQKASDHDGLFA